MTTLRSFLVKTTWRGWTGACLAGALVVMCSAIGGECFAGGTGKVVRRTDSFQQSISVPPRVDTRRIRPSEENTVLRKFQASGGERRLDPRPGTGTKKVPPLQDTVPTQRLGQRVIGPHHPVFNRYQLVGPDDVATRLAEQSWKGFEGWALPKGLPEETRAWLRSNYIDVYMNEYGRWSFHMRHDWLPRMLQGAPLGEMQRHQPSTPQRSGRSSAQSESGETEPADIAK